MKVFHTVVLSASLLTMTASCALSLASEHPTPQKPYRLAMSAAFVSEEGMPVYRQLAWWLSKKCGHEIEFIDGLGYATINQMLDAGAVDLAFVCGYPYVLLKDRPKSRIELLVAPVPSAPRYQGKPEYFSDLIVRKESTFKRLDDLRGKTYIYNEEISNSGYNMARYRLGLQDKANGFFGKVLRSGSHEESIRMSKIRL